MCLLTVTPEYKNKANAQPNRVVAAPKPTLPEPSQPTPHYVTCNANNTQQSSKEQGRMTENELLQLVLAAQRRNSGAQQQQKPTPPNPKPKEEHHYHHYTTSCPPVQNLARRRSSASSISVRSFESVRRRVGGLMQRVTVLERDRERKDWLAEAAAAERERRRDTSQSPRRHGGGYERVPDWCGRAGEMRERRRERFQQWY
ncbi:MAG: hypothetical protein M1830_003828 [Pleopsidium flavum]|nr:MAG: hypothetical protein M1830_003828 [Pleopsidium flavum]